jgi:hypothetical protein
VKLTELIAIEKETIDTLRRNALAGCAESARVLLEHLRATSLAISKWQKDKSQNEKTKTQQTEKP